jgi:hypothetical protein
MDDNSWEPTSRGGFRRTRVAQWQSAAQIRQWSGVRFLHRVLRVAWAEKLGLPSCPYVVRWSVQTPFGSVRLHHWLGPDDDRAYHDHPWWFVTLVLRGRYADKSPWIDGRQRGGFDYLKAGSIRFRPALHQHTVVPGKGGAWTLLVTGPPTRAWGFWKDGKFRKANKWFATFGHHPCS